MSGILAPWVVAIALVSYRAAVGGGVPNKPLGSLPLPSEYVSTAVVFGTLGVLDNAAPQGSTMWALMGWGFDLAIFLRLFGTAKLSQSPPDQTPGAKALATQAQQVQFASQASLGAAPTG